MAYQIKPPIKKGPMGGHINKGMASFEKSKDVKVAGKKLAKLLAEYKLLLSIVIIFAIGSTLFSITGPKILGNATTEIFNGIMSKIEGTGGINFDKIKNILLTVLALYGVSVIFMILQNYIMTGIAQKVTYKLRNQISEKLNKLPMKYFDNKTNGEVLSIITNDIDTLNTGLNQSITQIIASISTVIGILIMMFSISWEMTLASLTVIPLFGIILKKIVAKSQKYFIKQQEYLGHVNGQVEEIYSGHNIVKIFGREKAAISEFRKVNEELYKCGWKAQFLSGLMHPVMTFIGHVGYVIVAILGGYFAVKGRINIGNIQSFIQYNKQFNQPIGQVAQISSTIQSMLAAVERIFEFLEETEEIQNIKDKIDANKVKGNIEFKHVKFGYDENIVINDFSCKLKKGQKIAIVGPTGAGKSTIVKLLMRFYELNGGSISIDGKNINDFDKGEYRKLFGMVLQDTWLYSGSIKDNIKYGNNDASDEEVIEVAKATHIDHYIKTLPNGYNAEINEESSNISAGQKQLLTIARVMLANPKVLILDEATSSIDTRTEEQIQSAMDNLMKGRTSFIIAHRLSTIKNADLILVMDHGDIVEQGNHKELLEKNGFYANLYNSQFDFAEG